MQDGQRNGIFPEYLVMAASRMSEEPMPASEMGARRPEISGWKVHRPVRSFHGRYWPARQLFLIPWLLAVPCSVSWAVWWGPMKWNNTQIRCPLPCSRTHSTGHRIKPAMAEKRNVPDTVAMGTSSILKLNCATNPFKSWLPPKFIPNRSINT